MYVFNFYFPELFSIWCSHKDAFYTFFINFWSDLRVCIVYGWIHFIRHFDKVPTNAINDIKIVY